jgi:hypothetical protein
MLSGDENRNGAETPSFCEKHSQEFCRTKNILLKTLIVSEDVHLRLAKIQRQGMMFEVCVAYLVVS